MTIPTLLQCAKCGEVFGPETAESSVKALRDALALADRELDEALERIKPDPYGLWRDKTIQNIKAARAAIAAA